MSHELRDCGLSDKHTRPGELRAIEGMAMRPTIAPKVNVNNGEHSSYFYPLRLASIPSRREPLLLK
jgi:hypothetical protein